MGLWADKFGCEQISHIEPVHYSAMISRPTGDQPIVPKAEVRQRILISKHIDRLPIVRVDQRATTIGRKCTEVLIAKPHGDGLCKLKNEAFRTRQARRLS